VIKARIILAGGSGFIGRSLARVLIARGHSVVLLTRAPQARGDGPAEVQWDGEHPGPWMQSLEGAKAVVNLAGHTINCPHTPPNLAVITASRVQAVHALAAALPQLTQPPRVWVQASAVGFYGDTADQLCDESTPVGTGPLAEVCRHWEAAFHAVPLPRTRPVLLRIGLVLGRHGGALPVLSRLTRLFLGGAAGDGRQYLSWIHQSDLNRMFVAALAEDLSGIYNAVGPDPVTNTRFMRALRRTWRRPWSPPVPAPALRFGARLLNREAALALTGCRCLPRRFLDRGFQFEFNQLDQALADLCRGKVMSDEQRATR
jgi:hypothetical protein